MRENRENSEMNSAGKGTAGGRQKTSKQIEMEARLAFMMPDKAEAAPGAEEAQEIAPEMVDAVVPPANASADAIPADAAPTDTASTDTAPTDTTPAENASPEEGDAPQGEIPQNAPKAGDFIQENIVAVNGEPIAAMITQDAGMTEEKTLVSSGRYTAIVGRVVERVKTSIPQGSRDFIASMGRKLSAPLSIFLLVVMIAAIGLFIRNQYLAAVRILDTGPEKAYALEDEGNSEGAKQLWIQINAKMFWYQPFSGFLTNIDQPYLQKASVAYKAGDWQKVAENAYKSLQVPITDQQAVYAQQMILQATANMVKVYLPNQAEQPIRGGVPDHAQPVCEPSATYIWVIPTILVLLAGAFLYSRKKFLFATMAILMPCYFWALNASNAQAIKTCEARLDFNPEHITLYGPPKVPMPPFTPTPLRVESVPINKGIRPAPESAAKSDFGMPSEPLRIEAGNAPVRK